jgi:SAM-dependent methyltransferase
MREIPLCPICNGVSELLDVVDFSKSCEEKEGVYLGLTGIPIYYVICADCGFSFAPEIYTWSLSEFAEKIYNDEYISVDPDYVDTRPRENAGTLLSMFGDLPTRVRHLDYGGGAGLLASLLRESDWNSSSYDPFVNMDVRIEQLGKYDLITAFEVFEHVPDVQKLVSDLRLLLAPDGVILFSTWLSDGHIHLNERLSWWYAAPRNGHISLFSRSSLATLAQRNGWNFGSFSDVFHVFCASVPSWAAHVIR